MSRIKKYCKKTLFAIVVVLFAGSYSDLEATHIVGADMSFSCMAKDWYEIHLTVRRDCINGDEEAIFEDPAYAGIFDAYGTPLNWLGSLGAVKLDLLGITDITPNTLDCSYEGDPICVSEARYIGKVFLPFREKGYILGYQRCCRNITLNNIINPLETGNTSFVCLTEETLSSCNSSPEFQDWPDLVICSGTPLSFNSAAVDREGDSLSYMLYTPHAGASLETPQPIPPAGPPYDEVEYAPGFSLTNLLGSGTPLQIDPQTGIITATPGIVGQFLVGVLVEEWRNGVSLSKTRRNFEYNVRLCSNLAGLDFNVPSKQCEGLTVQVENTSTIMNQGFQWNFNYPSEDPAFISTEVSPSFTYSEKGKYTIQLVSTTIEDTCSVNGILREVEVIDSKLSASFSVNKIECVGDSIVLNLVSTSIEPNSNERIVSTVYNINADGTTTSYQGPDVTVKIACSNSISVGILVTSSDGCTADTIANYNIGGGEIPVVSFLGNPILVCPGESARIVANPNDNWTYNWDPVDELTFPDGLSNPIVTPTKNTTYHVTVTSGTASVVDSVRVLINDAFLELSIVNNSSECSNLIDLSAIANNAGNASVVFEWSSDPDFTTILASGQNVQVTIDSPTTIYLRGEGQDFCGSNIPSITISNGLAAGLDVEIEPVNLCVSNMGSVSILSKDPLENISVVWSPSENIISALNSTSVIVQAFPDQQQINLNYTVTDSRGCSETRSVSIPVINVFNVSVGLDKNICATGGQYFAISNINKDSASFEWSLTEDFATILTTNDTLDLEFVEGTVIYLRGASVKGCTSNVASIIASNSIFGISEIIEPVNTCVSNTGSVTVVNDNPNNIITVSWTASENITSSLEGLTVNVTALPGQSEFTLTYTVTDAQGCTDLRSVTIPVLDEFMVSVGIDSSICITGGAYYAEADVDTDSVSFEWSLSEDFAVVISTDDTLNMDFVSGTVIYLRGTSVKGCISNVASITATNSIVGISEIIEPINTCVSNTGSVTVVNDNPDNIITVSWTASENITSSLVGPSVNIVALPGQSAITLTYTVTDNQGCSDLRSVTIPILDEFILSVGIDSSICITGGAYYAKSEINKDSVSFEWSLSEDFTVVISTDDTLNMDFVEGTVIYLRGTSVKGCVSNVASITASNSIPGISENIVPINTCVSNTGSVNVVNSNPEITITVLWTASENITSSLEGPTVNVVALPGQTEITLTYTVTDNQGCSDLRSVTIPVLNEFTVSIGIDSSICITGGAYYANADIDKDSVSFEWSLSEDFALVISTNDTLDMDFVEGTVIYLRGTSVKGCVSNVASITASNSIPGISENIVPINTCVSNTGSVTVVNNNPETIIAVLWTASENITSSLEGPFVNVVALPGQTEITLTYTVTDNQGCSDLRSVTIPVLNEFTVSIGIDSSICITGGAYYANADIDKDSVSFEWSLSEDFAVVISTNDTLDMDFVEGTVIYLRGTSVKGCVSNVASITASNSIPGISENIVPINTCVSNTGSVTVVNNNPEIIIAVLWTASENITSSLEGPFVNVVALPGQSEITLTYTVTDNEGCTDLRSVTIPVIREFEISIGGDSDLCGAQGNYKAVSNIDLDSVSLEWSLVEDFSTVFSTDDSVSVSFPVGTTIYLRGTSVGGCISNVASETITEEITTLEVDAPSRICPGDTADIDIIIPEGTSLIVTWNPAPEIISGLNEPKVIVVATNTGSDTLRLSYTATDEAGCPFRGNIAIPYSTIVQPGPDSEIQCGTYSAQFSINPIYTDEDVFWDFGLVNGVAVTSTSANPSLDFGAAGLYRGTLSSTMETCNFEPLLVFVEIPEILEIVSDQGPEELLCEGDSLLTLGASGNGSIIVWTDQNNNLLGTGDSLTVDVRILNTVTATISDAFGCTDSLVFNVGIYQFDLSINGPANPICSSDPITLTAVDNTNSNLSYLWVSASGGVLSGDSTAIAMVDPAQAEDLILIATHKDFGCTTEIPFPVIGGKSVSATITATPGTRITAGESVDLTVVTDAEGPVFMWVDGNTNGNRTVSPTETTTYSVTVFDVNGCSADASITIIVDPLTCGNYFLPTAFTPNGDGNNDQLFVRSDAPLDFIDLQIIDRWGKEVFRTMDQNIGWNGQHRQNGKELAPDVYAYRLIIICNGEEIVEAGNISLLR